MFNFKKDQMGRRLFLLFISLIAMGFATSWLRPIALGSDPFTTVNVGFSMVLPISFGTAELLLNLSLLFLVLFVARDKIGLGTILNMVLIGYISDFFLWIWNHILPESFFSILPFRILVLIPAVAIFVLSCGGYMVADLGVSAFDAVPVWLHGKLQKRFLRLSERAVRMCWDWFYLILGAVLGAPIGVITVLMAFLLGPTIQFVKTKFDQTGFLSA